MLIVRLIIKFLQINYIFQIKDSTLSIKIKSALFAFGIIVLFSGFIFGIYKAIDAILKLIENAKKLYQERLLDLNNKILKIGIAIEEEALRVKEIPRYQELNSIMDEILSKVIKDRALNQYLEKMGYFGQWAYYDYCNYYLNGEFNKWPFALDHYRINDDAYGLVGSLFNKISKIFSGGSSSRVYDYTEYFEVQGSVNTEIAKKFRSLYAEKTNFEVHWDNLISEKKVLKNKINDLCVDNSGRITGIVFTCIGSALVTGFFIWVLSKFCVESINALKNSSIYDNSSLSVGSGSRSSEADKNDLQPEYEKLLKC